VALGVLIWVLGSSEKAQMRRHQVLHTMGFRQQQQDPWARYESSCDVDGATEILPPEVLVGRGSRAPQSPAAVLAELVGAPRPKEAPREVKVTHSYERDAYGRIVVVRKTSF